jgi:hypothetical protein
MLESTSGAEQAVRSESTKKKERQTNEMTMWDFDAVKKAALIRSPFL